MRPPTLPSGIFCSSTSSGSSAKAGAALNASNAVKQADAARRPLSGRMKRNMSRSPLYRPIMRLSRRVAAPAVERIVEKHAGFELRQVLGEHTRQTERGGEQARGFRRKVRPRRVGAAHNHRQPVERLGVQTELLDHHVEGAKLAVMAPEYAFAFDVERHGIEALRDRRHFGGRYVEKHCVGIDEAADQPGTGDAVDL